jgi:tetratricopeptide (TPR) repeat protein
MHIRARALQALSFLHYSQGDNPGAVEAGEECIPLARQVGDLRLLSICLAFTGSAKGFLGETEGALAYLEEAVSLARRHGKGFELGIALRTLATLIGIAHGDFKTAEAYEAEAFALAKGNADNWWGSTMSLVTSARGAVMRGDYASARAYLIECLPAFEQMGDVHRINMVYSELAHLDRYEGRYQEAAAAYRKTILAWQRLGHRAAVAHQLESFGFIAQRQGESGRAARLLGAADSLRGKINIPMYPAERAEYEEALEHLRSGMEAGEFDTGWNEGRAMTMEEAIEYARG